MDQVEAQLLKRIEPRKPEGVDSIPDPQGRLQDIPLPDTDPVCGCPADVRRGRKSLNLVSKEDREPMTNLGRQLHPSASDLRERS